jgi:hypothetical protein
MILTLRGQLSVCIDQPIFSWPVLKEILFHVEAGGLSLLDKIKKMSHLLHLPSIKELAGEQFALIKSRIALSTVAQGRLRDHGLA